MGRIEFIKRDKWRVLFLLALTAALPLMTGWHNPAGAQPITIFGFIAMMGWTGFIGMLLLPDNARAGFFNS